MYDEYPYAWAGHLDNRIPTLLPEFNPSSGKSLNSQNFVKRLNSLRNAYRWDDRKLLFATKFIFSVTRQTIPLRCQNRIEIPPSHRQIVSTRLKEKDIHYQRDEQLWLKRMISNSFVLCNAMFLHTQRVVS